MCLTSAVLRTSPNALTGNTYRTPRNETGSQIRRAKKPHQGCTRNPVNNKCPAPSSSPVQRTTLPESPG
eukprot:9328960-Lingulodinium_polyedra.AAC.1